jgi:adenine/guanine phosphoribosyltransferase-like PRPP-binding protein
MSGKPSTHRKDQNVIYNTGDFRDLKETAAMAAQDIQPYGDMYDALVCTGISGLAIAAPLSIVLDKPLAVVRKPGVNAHSGRNPGMQAGFRYLFIDDMVDTGATYERVLDAIYQSRGAIAGQYLYHAPGGEYLTWGAYRAY